MERIKKRKKLDVSYERKSVPVSLIDADSALTDWDKKTLKTRSAYFMLNGAPEFAVNEKEDGRFRLLALDVDFYAVKFSGLKEVTVRIYRFTDDNAEIFSIVERLKTEKLGAMDEAYLMKRLTSEFSLTQDDVASLIGISRPAVANTLRLLTLDGEVVGLIESGKLSAGHARTLVRVPKEKQLVFAQEAIKRGYNVREMERTVKAYLTPPEILQKENEAKAQARGAQLKAFVERMRFVYRTKVSLIGNEKKGRIYIDYYAPEDLYRFEELLDIIERFQNE
ncbi:MAG: ParB/RepB/Spo0J family partition protein [Clostridiales bacterium]|nr:ParB/RepB/Spo0J family partition protein [Clostridiales bacterium]